MDNISDYIVVERGGRQGCIFGGTIFNICYARAMKVFYSRVHDLGVPNRLRYVSACDPVSASTCNEHSEAIVLDVTFVDDEAIAVVATVPRTMTSKIKLVINVLNLYRIRHDYQLVTR